MKRVLLLLPTTSYRGVDFLAAAQNLGVEVVAVANYCHQLAPSWGIPPMMSVHFDRPGEAADTVLRDLGPHPDAVLAVDDTGVELAALLAERLGLPGNPPQAVRVLRDKLEFRRLQAARGLPHPAFVHLVQSDDPRARLADMRFPLVVKARRLSASRGVIRADDMEGLVHAVSRVRGIQQRADRDAAELGLLVEAFIPGREYALEGMLERGELETLALFDKPDPLDGPYFEETLYVTPSRLPAAAQAAIEREVAWACRLAGLTEGPVHAEARLNAEGIWLLEVAPRSIGGLCARVLRHSLGMSLEELILRRALAEPRPAARSAPRVPGAAGVMMIPIARRGIYEGVAGLEDARAVPGVTEVTLTAEAGQLIAPPPEGSSYLGFIFARAEAPEQAEAALREAHRRLSFQIRLEYPAAQTARQRQ